VKHENVQRNEITTGHIDEINISIDSIPGNIESCIAIQSNIANWLLDKFEDT
jgi:hypothetical protein